LAAEAQVQQQQAHRLQGLLALIQFFHQLHQRAVVAVDAVIHNC
jgi:hypothetical protein